ncbi:uncharacterized protein HKW66_Vig0138740 [Vigna angularis]|uniref:Organ-specific protein S2 n=1 Tax=Phaseolus angularis TaxID=3914 RepID=A0A8T0KDF7_PHAAN|nr:uncharacterized protein HKW66_Vig0138740 [Vigna angularis]
MEKLSGTIEARKDPGQYWKEIMKDQQMPEGLQGLLPFQFENHPKTQEQSVKDSKHECEEPLEPRPSVTKYNDLEPRPSVTKYDDFGLKLSASKNDDIESRPGATKYGDFEPRPSATKYDDFEVKLSANKKDDFEPRPSVTKYDDFEPRQDLESCIQRNVRGCLACAARGHPLRQGSNEDNNLNLESQVVKELEQIWRNLTSLDN